MKDISDIKPFENKVSRWQHGSVHSDRWHTLFLSLCAARAGSQEIEGKRPRQGGQCNADRSGQCRSDDPS